MTTTTKSYASPSTVSWASCVKPLLFTDVRQLDWWYSTGWTGGILGIYLSRNNQVCLAIDSHKTSELTLRPAQRRTWCHVRNTLEDFLRTRILIILQYFPNRMGNVWACTSFDDFYQSENFLPTRPVDRRTSFFCNLLGTCHVWPYTHARRIYTDPWSLLLFTVIRQRNLGRR